MFVGVPPVCPFHPSFSLSLSFPHPFLAIIGIRVLLCHTLLQTHGSPSILETEPASDETETSETMSQINNLSSLNLSLLGVHYKDKQKQQHNLVNLVGFATYCSCHIETMWQFLRVGNTSSPHEPRQALSHEDVSKCPKHPLRQTMLDAWSIPNESQLCGIGPDAAHRE